MDGPLFFINGCYCDACRKKFFGKYGKNYTEASFKEYMEFRMDSLAEFVGDIRSALDSVNPNIIVYLNNSALHADVTGSNTRKLWKYVDIIGAEGGFFVVNKVESIYKTSAFAKDIECKADGKPTVIFFAGDSKPNSYYMHTAQESMRTIAQSVSNGANIWYGLHGPCYLRNSEGGQRAKKFLEYLKEYEEYYRQTKPCAKIALCWSTDTANYYSSNVGASDFTGEGTSIGNAENRCDHNAEFMGIYELLVQNHIQFDVIDEVSLERGEVDKYQLIITPACACMTERAARTLKDFVANGGNVISSFALGMYDEKGDELKEGLFSDMFGAHQTGVLRTWEGLSYQHLDEGKFGNLPKILPAPTLTSLVKPCGASVDSLRYPPIPGRYETLGEPDENTPAILKNAYGKGNAVLFTGNIGTYYFEWKDKNHLALFKRYVEEYGDVLTLSDAPKCVEITLRKQSDRYICHLINNCVGTNRPMDEIIPIYRFTVTVKGIKASARTVQGERIRSEWRGEDTVIYIERLDDYMAVVLE